MPSILIPSLLALFAGGLLAFVLDGLSPSPPTPPQQKTETHQPMPAIQKFQDTPDVALSLSDALAVLSAHSVGGWALCHDTDRGVITLDARDDLCGLVHHEATVVAGDEQAAIKSVVRGWLYKVLDYRQGRLQESTTPPLPHAADVTITYLHTRTPEEIDPSLN